MADGAIVVICDKSRNEYLVGKGSSFVKDTRENRNVIDHFMRMSIPAARPPPVDDSLSIQMLGVVEQDKIIDDIAKIFSSKKKGFRKELEKHRGFDGDFFWDIPEFYQDTETHEWVFKTRLLYDKASNEWGFPKGGRDPLDRANHPMPRFPDLGDDSALKNMYRELFEEVGYVHPRPKDFIEYPNLSPDGYTVFFLYVNRRERREIESCIKERERIHMGEMYDIAFKDIMNARGVNINDKSSKVLRNMEEIREYADKIITTEYNHNGEHLGSSSNRRRSVGKPATRKPRGKKNTRRRRTPKTSNSNNDNSHTT